MSNARYIVPCIVTGNALAESKEKRTPSVKISLRTQDENPRTLYADLYLTDAAFNATIETLETALGWSGMSLAELNDPVLKGVEVDAVCEIEEYPTTNGMQQREAVRFLNAPGSGGGVKKMDSAQVQGVVNRLDALLSRARMSRGGSTTQGATKRPTPPQHGRRQAAPQGANDFPGFAPVDEGL